jgi:hypothetical protein
VFQQYYTRFKGKDTIPSRRKMTNALSHRFFEVAKDLDIHPEQYKNEICSFLEPMKTKTYNQYWQSLTWNPNTNKDWFLLIPAPDGREAPGLPIPPGEEDSELWKELKTILLDDKWLKSVNFVHHEVLTDAFCAYAEIMEWTHAKTVESCKKWLTAADWTKLMPYLHRLAQERSHKNAWAMTG